MWITDFTHPDGGYHVGDDNPPEPMLINPTNEDGTEFNPPKNPLLEKWFREHPPIKMPQYSQVCDGYSCMWCDRCPHGDAQKRIKRNIKNGKRNIKNIVKNMEI